MLATGLTGSTQDAFGDANVIEVAITAVQARQAQLAFQPSSLDAPQPDHGAAITLADSLGEEDPRLDHMLGMQAVSAHWGELPLRGTSYSVITTLVS